VLVTLVALVVSTTGKVGGVNFIYFSFVVGAVVESVISPIKLTISSSILIFKSKFK